MTCGIGTSLSNFQMQLAMTINRQERRPAPNKGYNNHNTAFASCESHIRLEIYEILIFTFYLNNNFYTMMKRTYLILILGLIFNYGFSQESKSSNNHYNIFSCKDCNNKYFIATNSGIKNTPLGIRIGFLCKTGAYIGARFGKGELYHSDSDFSTTKTKLSSLTAGLIKPVLIQGNFSVHVFVGAGYGQWWPYRWERWTKEGVEVEGGLMTSYKRFMLNVSANMLNGSKTYAIWDFTIGLGYRF